jgi:hypothetical protein
MGRGKSLGSEASTVVNASRPPADPARTTISYWDVARLLRRSTALRCFRPQSEGSFVEAGRLCDRLATAEDNQAAKATDAPMISTVTTYRA